MYNLQIRKINLKIVIIVFSVLAFLITSFVGLYVDVINPDGINWHNRSNAFVNGLVSGNLSETYQVYHPGITLMWITGPVLYNLGNYFQDQGYRLYSKDTFLTYDYVAKASVVIVVTLLFLITLLLLKDILSESGLLLFSVLMIFEPFSLGERRLFHLDSLMVYAILVSFLSFYQYFYIKKRSYYLFLGSFFLVFAILTKTSSLIYIPIVFLMLVLGRLGIKRKIVSLLLISISSILFIYILFPAVWSNPIRSFPLYFEKLKIGVVNIGYEGRREVGSSGKADNLILSKTIRKMPWNYYLEVMSYRLSYGAWYILFVSSLMLFVAFLYCIYSCIRKRECGLTNKLLLLFSILVIIDFYLAYTVSTKTDERYSLIFFPFLFLILSIIFSLLRLRIILIISIMYIVSLIPQYKEIYPYYHAYGNPLLGGVYGKNKELKSPQFGVAIFEVYKEIIKDRQGNDKPFTIAGPKSLKAISYGAKAELSPNCTTDYYVNYAYDRHPKDYCVGKTYILVSIVKVGNMDYWYIYKRNRPSL